MTTEQTPDFAAADVLARRWAEYQEVDGNLARAYLAAMDDVAETRRINGEQAYELGRLRAEVETLTERLAAQSGWAENEMREADITAIAKAVARVVDGDDAGWGIWADLVRVTLHRDY